MGKRGWRGYTGWSPFNPSLSRIAFGHYQLQKGRDKTRLSPELSPGLCIWAPLYVEPVFPGEEQAGQPGSRALASRGDVATAWSLGTNQHCRRRWVRDSPSGWLECARRRDNAAVQIGTNGLWELALELRLEMKGVEISELQIG